MEIQDGHPFFKMATIYNCTDVADDQKYSSLSCMTMKFGIKAHTSLLFQLSELVT